TGKPSSYGSSLPAKPVGRGLAPLHSSTASTAAVGLGGPYAKSRSWHLSSTPRYPLRARRCRREVHSTTSSHLLTGRQRLAASILASHGWSASSSASCPRLIRMDCSPYGVSAAVWEVACRAVNRG